MPNVRGRSNPVNPHDIPDTPAHGVETTTRRDGVVICNICGKPV